MSGCHSHVTETFFFFRLEIRPDLLACDIPCLIVRYKFYFKGSDVVKNFCETNNIDMIARAHQLVMEGYKWHFNETVLTVWSAPNYCYRCGNVAAILELDEQLNKDFTIFEAAPQDNRGAPAKKPQPDYFL
ncbi:unnamed protein product [Meloidogyne enterolobii]|uniref:Uncharacterized protein n=1 Tax=Meloidogyne enterolobii TaxID=390850 RepID=A0ACB1AZM8_MELEN